MPDVIVTVPPVIEQPPVVVMATVSPELAVAATGKVLPYVALAGACVETAIVWFARTVCAVVLLLPLKLESPA